MAGPSLATAEETTEGTPADAEAVEQPAEGTPAEGEVAATAEGEGEGGDEEKVEELYVTGTRIRRLDLVTPAPVTVLTKQDIDASGLASIGDILQNLPVQSNAINVQFNNGGDGSTRVNIRGIGTARTLVLLNGRRFVPGGLGANSSVDLNSIPVSVIDRVEVLKDGASAIYGSDAMGGVVNIITKREFAGVEANVYLGTTKKAGSVYSLGVSGGESGERASFMLSFEYFHQSPVLAGQRDYSKSDLDYDYETGEVYTEGSSSIPQGYFRDSGEGPGNDTWERLVAQYPDDAAFMNDAVDGFRPFRPTGNYDVGEGDFYNYQPENYLLTPSQRMSFYAQGNYDLHEHITAYFEGLYTNRRSDQLLAPEPLFTITEGIAVSADNVYNPFGRDFYDVRRRLVEFGNREFIQDINTYRAALGLQGTMPDDLGPLSTFKWDVSFNYGRTSGTELNRGRLILPRLSAAIGPSFYDANGVARCGTPDAPIDGCVPLNLFGGPGTITQDMKKYLSYEGTMQGYTDQRNITVDIEGELFEIWEGFPVSLAIGYLNRRESGDNIPDPFTATGQTTGNKASPVGGAFTENAGYLELNVPLLVDLPAFKMFEINGALRVFDFDSYGTDFMWKGGARWQIVDHLALRGTFSRAFRAPSIGELYSGNDDSFEEVEDPCSGADPTSVAGRNCAADGIPADFETDQTQFRTLVGGNPNLDPETASIFTAGVVVTPKVNKWTENLSLTFDLFFISVTDAIQAVGADVIINGCYNQENRTYCEKVTRDARGNISLITDPVDNIGGNDTSGLDFALQYAVPTDAGRFRFTFEGTYLFEYTETQADGTVKDGKGVYDLETVFPDIKFNTSLAWDLKGVSAGFNLRFIGAIQECLNNDCATELAKAAGETQFVRDVDANITADLWLGYGFSNPLGYTSLSGGINNLFDQDPPVIYNGFLANSDAANYDYLGRYFYLSLRHQL